MIRNKGKGKEIDLDKQKSARIYLNEDRRARKFISIRITSSKTTDENLHNNGEVREFILLRKEG